MFIKKNKTFKFIVASLSAVTLSTVVVPTAVTYAETNNTIEQKEVKHPGQYDLTLSDDSISETDVEFLNKVASIGKYFYLDENDNSQLDLSIDELVSDYNFTLTEANTLLDGLSQQQVDVPPTIIDGPVISPAAHVEGGRLYISNSDLQSGAFAAVASAATVGPAALKAAFIAASTAVGGPVGTFISSAMAIVGGPGLIDLGAHIVTALAVGEGVWVGVQARYPFIDVGYWAG